VSLENTLIFILIKKFNILRCGQLRNLDLMLPIAFRTNVDMKKNKNILILFAHLGIQHSKIHKAMVAAIRDAHFIEFHDLLETYPDFYFDINAERELLASADLIIFQHPIYWYSAPAILKHWQDMVLTRGYAYGAGGDALKGKDFMLSVSTGGDENSYQPTGAHGRPLKKYFHPSEQMAKFCGMNWLPPFILQGGHNLVQSIIDDHAQSYRKFLNEYTKNT